MKRLLTTITCTCLIAAASRTLCAATPAYSASWLGTLLPVRQNHKWGYIDRAGKVVIKPQFDMAGDFFEGMALVYTGGPESTTFGYIDQTGKVVVKPAFAGTGIEQMLSNLSDGLAAVPTSGKKWTYINKAGRPAFAAKFDAAYPFTQGLAAVKTGGKWGYINKTGAYAIEPRFDAALSFSDGLAAVRIGDTKTGKWGFIDQSGKLVIEPQYRYAYDFSEGLAEVANEYWKIGYIDRTGTMVIQPQFSNAFPFSDGLAMVAAEKPYYIDTTGKKIVDTQGATKAMSFCDGLAAVMIGNFMDYMNENPSSPEKSADSTPKWGFIDKTGKVVIAPQFGFVGTHDGFSQGIARVWAGLRYIGMGGGPSYIDRTGKYIWKDGSSVE